jgi:hypothetical protein
MGDLCGVIQVEPSYKIIFAVFTGRGNNIAKSVIGNKKDRAMFAFYGHSALFHNFSFNFSFDYQGKALHLQRFFGIATLIFLTVDINYGKYRSRQADHRARGGRFLCKHRKAARDF